MKAGSWQRWNRVSSFSGNVNFEFTTVAEEVNLLSNLEMV
jgi:hypothetical protein